MRYDTGEKVAIADARVDGGSRPVTVVWAITLVAAALRVASMGRSLFADELFTYEIAIRPDLHAVIEGVRSNLETTPPLYFVVAWASQHLGDPLLWLRMPSLLAGVATVPLVYLLGLRTVGRPAAVLGAGLFALSPMAIFYATEARAYAVMTMLVVISTLTLLHALERRSWPWWVLLAIVNALAMYSHYTSVFVLAAQAGWALVTRRDLLWPLLMAHAGAAVLFSPWISGLRSDSHAPAQKVIANLYPFTRRHAVETVERLVAGGPFAPLGVQPGKLALVMLGVAGSVGMVGLALRAWRTGRRAVTDRTVLVALLAVAAPVGAAVYSAVGDSLFVPRNLISSLPAVLLVLAALLVALARPLALATAAVATVAMGVSAATTLQTDTQRPAYKQAAEFVEARARPADVVVELSYFSGPPGRMLRVELDPRVRLFELNRVGQAVSAARQGGGRIFVVSPEGLVSALPGHLRAEQVVQRAAGGSLRPVGRKTWRGIYPVTVVVLAPRVGTPEVVQGLGG